MAKSLVKNFKNLFFTEEAEDKAAPQTTASSGTKGTSTPTPVAPTTNSPTAPQQDETVAKMLSDALDQANMEGFDYYEYAQMLQALKPSLPSEQTLFQTAFTSGKVMGASKEKLIQSANFYLDILKKKAGEFEAACKAKIDELVTGREKELQNMDATIKEKADAIQKLTEEINNLSTQKTQITNEIGENRIKIETKRNNFNTTLQTFTGRISGDIEKITRYIQ